VAVGRLASGRGMVARDEDGFSRARPKLTWKGGRRELLLIGWQLSAARPQ
jgi:hypothetical protein